MSFEIESAAIIGLNGIGASLAMALRDKAGIRRIVGVDSDGAARAFALNNSIVSKARASIDGLLEHMQVVFICGPEQKVVSSLRRLAGIVGADCLITDTGRDKKDSLHTANALNMSFIGGYPELESVPQSIMNASGTLFEGVRYLLVPRHTKPDCAPLCVLLRKLGAVPEILSLKEYNSMYVL